MSQRSCLYLRLLMFALGYSEQYEGPVPLMRGSYVPYCWCLFAHLKQLTCYFNLYLLHWISFFADYFIYFRIVLVHEENVQYITIDAYLMIKTLKNGAYDEFACVCIWGHAHATLQCQPVSSTLHEEGTPLLIAVWASPAGLQASFHDSLVSVS